jgi:hypothetical protein
VVPGGLNGSRHGIRALVCISSVEVCCRASRLSAVLILHKSRTVELSVRGQRIALFGSVTNRSNAPDRIRSRFSR